MSKIIISTLICASLFSVIGCTTSNRDYSASSLVVDVTAPRNTKSAGVAPVNQYNKGQLASRGNTNSVAQNTNRASATRVNVNNTNINSNAALEQRNATTVAPVNKESVSANTLSGDRYQVVAGDTLYSIAFRYGLDYRDLAKKNGIEAPYNIAVGQILALNLNNAKAPEYIVKRGDTLYSIAKSNGQSVDFLAGVNGLNAPYTLEVGQKLSLARKDGNTTSKAKVETTVPVAGEKKAPQKEQVVAKTDDKRAESVISQEVTTPVVSGKSRSVSGVSWTWPTRGRVVKQFSLAEHGNKGIDIAGNRGQQVLAASDGQVVYAGNALRGYGNLVIINHANEFLSAYAHNEELLVKEGQKVKRGQQIAKMGSTDAESVGLHFEIRYRGQSVNPVNYLPK